MSCDRQAIVILTDGENRPAINSLEYEMMLAIAENFKQGGGVLICVGIRAAGEGYALLQKLASPGYFINLFGDGTTPVTGGITALTGLMGYYCAGALPTEPVGQQPPDPYPLDESESVTEACPVVDELPQLPDVAFDPANGATVEQGDRVTLSVPGHSDAIIRFTMNVATNPSFAFVESASVPPYTPSGDTGQAYEGSNVPLPITVSGAPVEGARLRAIARKTGYRDSNPSTALYVPG